MPDKLVFVKELKTGTSDKTNNTWPEIIDQDNDIWRIFRQPIKIELGKAYLITFHINEKGFKDIDEIKPVVNVFHQKALAETANRNDYKRDYSIAITQAIQFIGADNAKLDDVFLAADKIYQRVNQVADDEMARFQSEGKNDQTK